MVVEALYIPYLLLLLLLPLLVQWRWGVAAALLLTFAELGLVGLLFYLLEAYHLFPKPYGGEPPPLTDPEGLSRWEQTVGGALVYIWLYIPGVAALAGGVLAMASAAMIAIWRAVFARPRLHGRRPVDWR